MMALMIIAATYVAPRMVQQLKRDREEEMIHRGTEYARAIKKYYKKFGRVSYHHRAAGEHQQHSFSPQAV